MGLLATILESIAVFAGAALLAFAFHRWPFKRAKRLELPEGAVVKLRGRKGMYRSRLIAPSEAGWRIGAPLQRDSYVPLRPGESITVEAATPKGLISFRSQVLA